MGLRQMIFGDEGAATMAIATDQEVRELQRQLRDMTGTANDRGRQLDLATRRIEELQAQVEGHRSQVTARDWQLEQMRERARSVMGKMRELTDPVQGMAVPMGQMVELGMGANVPRMTAVIREQETIQQLQEAGALPTEAEKDKP
jgi:chromosome segregation ATPase